MKGLVSGGIGEQRRRALQIVLTGDAELRVTGYEEFFPLWEASGEIDVAPGTDCENDEGLEVEEDASSDESKEDASSAEPEI